MKKRAKKAEAELLNAQSQAQSKAQAQPQASAWPSVAAFLNHHARWIIPLLVLIATARIAATYPVLSHTFDEPVHLATGIEWIEKGTYTLEPQHPPLTRVAIALLPWLNGARGGHAKGLWDEGLGILYATRSFDNTLTLARLGTLPFFWLGCWAVFLIARWISASTAVAVIAVFFLTMTPAVLAHAGLATTDMGHFATFLLATYTAWRFAAEPTWPRAIYFGLATGLAVLAKFSVLAFFPTASAIGLGAWYSLERPSLPGFAALIRTRLPGLAAAIAIGALIIWTGYRFSFGTTKMFSFAVPAPELFDGVLRVQEHDGTGHLTYLMGRVNTVGWWNFYLVALGVKTPLAILLLGLPGLWLLARKQVHGRRGWLVLSLLLGVLAYASFLTQIKIGTRHIIPVFGVLAISSAITVAWLLERRVRWAPVTAAAALAWLTISSLAAHPDYIPYFNALAGGRGENYLVDSDLDWGQDVKRLGARLREVGAKEVFFNQYAPAELEKRHGFPPLRPLDVQGPGLGWNAVSLTPLKYGLFGDTRYQYDADFRFWVDDAPGAERIGGGILLIRNPPQ